jgi:GT2 family glycosyltransferase
MTDDGLRVSVVVPTVGRALLEDCLQSILACAVPADEIIVVDQSHDTNVARLVDALDAPAVRRVSCDGVGTARAMNRGLADARHDTVLVTHDDCTVADDWVEIAKRHARAHPDGIVTGRVLPAGDAQYVPSTKSDPEPQDYTGMVTTGVLYPANMVVNRLAIQDIGGFDERRSLLVAEDNDLCYRWLAAGRTLRYEPDLVVWHNDWRTPEQLVRTHVAYARAQGGFYAKHLRAGDRRVLPLLRWDLRHGARSVVRGTLRRTPRWQDPYREMVVSLLAGMATGYADDRRLRRDDRRLRPSAPAG